MEIWRTSPYVAVIVVGIVVTSLVASVQTGDLEKRVLDKARVFSSMLGAHLDRVAGDNIAAYDELQAATVKIAGENEAVRSLSVIAPECVVLSSTTPGDVWKRLEQPHLKPAADVAGSGKPRAVVRAAPGTDMVIHFMPLTGKDPAGGLIGVMQVAVEFPSEKASLMPSLRTNRSAYFRKEAAALADRLAVELAGALEKVQKNFGYLKDLTARMAGDEEIIDVMVFSKDLRLLGSGGRGRDTGVITSLEGDGTGLYAGVMDEGRPVVIRGRLLVGGEEHEAVRTVGPLYLSSRVGQEVVGAVEIILSMDRVRAMAAGRRNLVYAVGLSATAALCLLTGLVFKMRSQREMRDWNVRLRQRVDEISGELREQQARLVESEKLAGLGILSSGIAHEINNPLGVILGDTQLLLEEAEERGLRAGDNDTVELLQTVERNAKRCSQIVKNLLQFARSGEARLRRTNVPEVLERALEFSGSHLAGKDIEVSKEIEDDLPTVEASEVQLEQVFVNIILNAVHSIAGSGRLGMAARREKSGEGAADIVSIRFEDTGGGISEENLGRIFDPFFTTKEPGDGVGLGLSVSYGIIQAHGGNIEVESRPGEGTSVTVTLPAGDK